MQLTIIATSVVFIIEHPFMDNAAVPKWIDLDNKMLMTIVYYFADPAAKFGVPPTKVLAVADAFAAAQARPQRRIKKRNPVPYKR